jgi:uncharacterized protein (DUF1919 family)
MHYEFGKKDGKVMIEVNKKISVIITCFNQEAFIEEAIRSVLNQTYKNWECIVVNDGSTDKSQEIIEKLAAIDKRIKYVLQENKGVSKSRNKGFVKSSGQYIQFLDGDDYIEPEKLEIQVDFMEDNPFIGVSYTNHKHYLQEENISKQYYFKPLKGKVLSEILYEYDNGVSIPIHTAVLRKNIWNENELPFPADYDGRYEDWIFWVSIALKETNFRFLNYDMAFYRIHNNNFCNSPEVVLTNSIKALEYISEMSSKIQKETFILKKKLFFENRYVCQTKGKKTVDKLAIIFQKIRHRLGDIKRNNKAKKETKIEEKYCLTLQNQVLKKDFTIISNNCWGGGIYEDLQLPYKTPTVGLYFFPSCYLKFVSNLEEYLSLPLTFITTSKYHKANLLRENNPYPIGLLNDEVEIHFLHYHTKREALEKWNRRRKRINMQNLFLSFTDNEGYSGDELLAFDKLNYRKVFFSSKEIPELSCAVHLKKFNGKKNIGDIYSDRWAYRIDFNVANWLNNFK